MATVPAPQTRERPPDVRGPTSPFSAGTFAAGITALVVELGGLAVVQAAYALGGGPLTPACIAEGLTHYTGVLPQPGVKGAEGICHIVTGLKAPAQTVLLLLGIAVGAGAIVAGFGYYKRMDTKRKREQCLAGAILGIQAVILATFLLFFRNSVTLVKFVRNFLNFAILHGFLGAFLTGAKNTLLLALGGEVGGVILGLILAMFTMSSRRVVRAPARIYVNFFRGTPLIWQLSFFYFGFSLGLGLRLGAYVTALLVFSLNAGAYSSEVFRAGVQSIERGQMEAARGLGFSYLQAMRYAILTQAIRRVIPPLMNEFVILIKDTALVTVLGLLASQYELYVTAQNGYSQSFSATFFVAAAIGYLAITLPLIRAVNAVERRLRSGLVGIAGAGGA